MVFYVSFFFFCFIYYLLRSLLIFFSGLYTFGVHYKYRNTYLMWLYTQTPHSFFAFLAFGFNSYRKPRQWFLCGYYTKYKFRDLNPSGFIIREQTRFVLGFVTISPQLNRKKKKRKKKKKT